MIKHVVNQTLKRHHLFIVLRRSILKRNIVSLSSTSECSIGICIYIQGYQAAFPSSPKLITDTDRNNQLSLIDYYNMKYLN